MLQLAITVVAIQILMRHGKTVVLCSFAVIMAALGAAMMMSNDRTLTRIGMTLYFCLALLAVTNMKYILGGAFNLLRGVINRRQHIRAQSQVLIDEIEVFLRTQQFERELADNAAITQLIGRFNSSPISHVQHTSTTTIHTEERVAAQTPPEWQCIVALSRYIRKYWRPIIACCAIACFVTMAAIGAPRSASSNAPSTTFTEQFKQLP